MLIGLGNPCERNIVCQHVHFLLSKQAFGAKRYKNIDNNNNFYPGDSLARVIFREVLKKIYIKTKDKCETIKSHKKFPPLKT